MILETEDMQAAKERDSQLEMATSLLIEAERLVKEGKVKLPDDMSFSKLENSLEDIFIGFAENRDGMKRAMKGEAYCVPSEQKESGPAAPTGKQPRAKKTTKTPQVA